ncbi:MAG: hypothetical protein AAB425_11780, partial [Bdellovibrionota bacterium]
MGNSRLFGAALGGIFGMIVSFGIYRLTGGLIAAAALSAAAVPGTVFDLNDIIQRVASVTNNWSLNVRQLAICSPVGPKIIYSIPTIMESDFCTPSWIARNSFSFIKDLSGFDSGLFLVWDPGPGILLFLVFFSLVSATAAGFAVSEWIRRYYENQARIQVDAALGRVAGQVAHDIRSPLGALNVFLTEVKSGDKISEEAIEIGTLASARIMQIADDLLKVRR